MYTSPCSKSALLTKEIDLPSGDQAADMSASGSIDMRLSVPVLRSRTQTSMPPARSDENAIFVPSGDHAGSVSTYASLVSCFGVPPDRGIVQMSPSAAKASVLPSGETTGW